MALSPIAIQAGVVMPGASAYALASASLTPVITLPFEPLASYDWVFGSDYGDLSDQITGAKLQPNIALTIASGGTGYESTGVLTFSGGGATTQATGIWFAASGVITGVYLTSPGTGYTSAPTISATTSSGTGAAITAVLRGVNTLTANSVVLPATALNGLITPFTEQTDQTICAVFKINKSATGTNISPVFGTLFSTAVASNNGGSGLYLSGNTSNPVYNTTTRPGTPVGAAAPAGAVDGQYAFVAMSEAPAGARLVYWGGPSATVYTGTQVKTMMPTPPKVYLGQGYYNNQGYAMEVAELIIIPRATTQAELDAVYARAKTRLAARGITIF